MKRTLVWEKSFLRAFKRTIKNNSSLKGKIFAVLDKLTDDPFHPSLNTHKLHGILQGLYSMQC